MIRKPFNVLVCLAIVATFVETGIGWGYYTTRIAAAPGVEADALSAEPTIRRVRPAPTRSTRSSQAIPRYPRYNTAPARPPVYSAPMPGPGMMPQLPGCQPLIDRLCGPGFPFRPLSCNAFLPRAGCKQFQLSARLWYAKLNASTLLWGTNYIGGPGTELDLHEDLDLGRYAWIGEYEAMCQIKSNWGIRYTFRPLELQQTHRTRRGFFFGNFYYPQYTQIYTKWNRYVQSFDLVYRWFNQKHAYSTIFAGGSLYDDKISISAPPWMVGTLWSQRSRSKTFWLAFVGGSVDRMVRNVGGCGVASMHCKWSFQFAEGYVGYDGYAAGRITVPFNCGRFGYMEAGWRWIVLERSYPTDVDRTSMDGLIGAVGIIF